MVNNAFQACFKIFRLLNGRLKFRVGIDALDIINPKGGRECVVQSRVMDVHWSEEPMAARTHSRNGVFTPCEREAAKSNSKLARYP